MTATGHIASITLPAIPAILLSMLATAAQRRPAGQSAPSLIVTPSTSIAFSGPRGGPFAPSLVEYRVSASTDTVNYSIRTPSWLTASSISGAIHTSGVTITLKVNASASTLPRAHMVLALCSRTCQAVQRNQVREADCPGVVAPSSDRPNRAWPRRVLAGQQRRISVGRSRRPPACGMSRTTGVWKILHQPLLCGSLSALLA